MMTMKRLLIVALLLVTVLVSGRAEKSWNLCVELTNGRVEEFLMSDNFPRLCYRNQELLTADESYKWFRVIQVDLENSEVKYFLCDDVRRIYVQNIDTGVADKFFDTSVRTMDVYTSGGLLVRRGTTSLEGLSKGLYVIKQREKTFKFISR